MPSFGDALLPAVSTPATDSNQHAPSDRTYLWRHHADEYLWFMKVDHDSYLNSAKMAKMMTELENLKYLRNNRYIGMPATGRSSERKQLGLNGRPYCSGLGYLMNFRALKAYGPHTASCNANTVSNHSDTEVGRCIHKHADADCALVKGFTFKQVYYQQDGARVFPMKLVKGGQMKLTFPRYPKEAHFTAAVLHPLKRTEDFYRFHKQSMSGLRPVQPQISKADSDPDSCVLRCAWRRAVEVI